MFVSMKTLPGVKGALVLSCGGFTSTDVGRNVMNIGRTNINMNISNNGFNALNDIINGIYIIEVVKYNSFVFDYCFTK
jgi:hypothetical protein